MGWPCKGVHPGGYVSELRAVGASIGDLMGHDQRHCQRNGGVAENPSHLSFQTAI
jgi:hypothetical protein